MKRTVIIAGVALLALIGVGAWLFRDAEASEDSLYRLAAVERGDIESAVTATGTLNAVRTVQVGTQVSGKVTELHADFNDRVRKGQLIARIDPTLQQQTVREAEANFERNRAELERARREYERNLTLFERKVITDAEFNSVQYNYAVAQASMKSAQVSVDRARQNLAYTEIYAPIDGIVVERNVEPGQTVAASLSAPQLFLIANDLSEMEILASVDESDIGRIKPGQSVRFTVQAYPEETFQGAVRQVRLQSTTTENVVNYTAVIAVKNVEGKLLPGMTASVDFMVEAASDVLKVSNAALRFRPTEEMLAQLGDSTLMSGRGPGTGGGRGPGGPAEGPGAGQAGPRASGPSGGGGFAERRSGGPGGGRPGGGASPGGPGGGGSGAEGRGSGARRPGGRGNSTMLWYLKDGKLAAARVRTGISDGRETQIEGREIREGMEVIVGVNSTEEEGGSRNPFQQAPQSGGFGSRGPGGF